MTAHELKLMLHSVYGVNSNYGSLENMAAETMKYCAYDAAIDNYLNNRIAENRFTIKRVIFNDPATVVYWTDGTKTVVKATGEKFDPEKGLAMAIAKRAFGNAGNYYNVFRKWCGGDK